MEFKSIHKNITLGLHSMNSFIRLGYIITLDYRKKNVSTQEHHK